MKFAIHAEHPCELGCGGETTNENKCCDACLEAEERAEEKYDRASGQYDANHDHQS